VQVFNVPLTDEEIKFLEPEYFHPEQIE